MLLLFLAAIPAASILFIVVVAVVGWSVVVSEPLNLAWIRQPTRGLFGPLVVAAVIALVSIPILAATLGLFDTLKELGSDTPPLSTDDIRRWKTVAGCAVPSVLVAGTAGAPAVRRHCVTGAVFTFLVALGVAIAAMPIVLALLGKDLGVGRLCIDACSAIVHSNNPTSGLVADVLYGWAPFFEPVAVATLALGVAVWTAAVRAFFTSSRHPGGLANAPILTGLAR